MNLDNIVLIIFITISLLLVTRAVVRRERSVMEIGHNSLLFKNDYHSTTRDFYLERIKPKINSNNPVAKSSNITFSKEIERIRNRHFFGIKNYKNKTINFTYDVYQNDYICNEFNNTNCSIGLIHFIKDIKINSEETKLILFEYTLITENISTKNFQIYVCNKKDIITNCHPELVENIYGKTNFTINII